ncbi:hypothetical protein KKF34_14160 [Myxococcota bacterium]|nr:hypothetical protein [Myxococcota bacterium]MBU1379626.1 hypothetical protein [Myxococcota bacterium]MBU1498017.1 hypothetical protein [Myxococcota bacterium]
MSRYSIIISIASMSLLLACTGNQDAYSTYNNFTKAWKKHDKAGIKKYVATPVLKRYSASTLVMFSKEPDRKPVKISSKSDKKFFTSVTTSSNTMSMVFRDGKWFFTGLMIPVYSSSTPEETVKSFIKALKFQRIDIISSLLVEDYRLSIKQTELAQIFSLKNPEIKQLLNDLEKAKDTPIITRENTAVLQYSDSKSFKMKRVGSKWLIVDPD